MSGHRPFSELKDQMDLAKNIDKLFDGGEVEDTLKKFDHQVFLLQMKICKLRKEQDTIKFEMSIYALATNLVQKHPRQVVVSAFLRCFEIASLLDEEVYEEIYMDILDRLSGFCSPSLKI